MFLSWDPILNVYNLIKWFYFAMFLLSLLPYRCLITTCIHCFAYKLLDNVSKVFFVENWNLGKECNAQCIEVFQMWKKSLHYILSDVLITYLPNYFMSAEYILLHWITKAKLRVSMAIWRIWHTFAFIIPQADE